MNQNLYLFSWEKVPGNDSKRLIEFLMQNLNIEWIKAAKINKNDDGKTIRITNDTNFLSLTLNIEKNNVNLEIDDGRTDKFIVKTENGELNIYQNLFDKQKQEAELLNDILNDLKNLMDKYIPFTLGLDDPSEKKISELLNALVFEDLSVFSLKDPASKGRPQYIRKKYKSSKAVMYYRLANLIFYCKNLEKNLREEYARGISEEIKVETKIEIHPGAKIGSRFVVDHGIGTVIGETCEIGNDCYILQGVTLGARKIASNITGKRHPTIGNSVEIGAFARIFGPYSIGDNVNISSHCVIKQDIPSYQNVVIINQLQLSTDMKIFNWNEIPGDDTNKLIDFIRDYLDLHWVENAEIVKKDRKISIFDREKSLDINLDENEKEVILISDDITFNLQAKDKNGELNIYNIIPNKIEIYGIIPEKKGMLSIFGSNLINTSLELLDNDFHIINELKFRIISNENNCIRIKLYPEKGNDLQKIKNKHKKLNMKLINDLNSIIVIESIGLKRTVESIEI